MRPSKNLENSISSKYKIMHESSGSQFIRTATRINPGPNASEELRWLMAVLSILGII